MVGKIIIIVIAAAYVAFNCIVSKRLTTKEMAGKFITGQNVVGRIATNIFYSPAWLLKGVKFLAVNLIK
jgi:hypothetical protein